MIAQSWTACNCTLGPPGGRPWTRACLAYLLAHRDAFFWHCRVLQDENLFHFFEGNNFQSNARTTMLQKDDGIFHIATSNGMILCSWSMTCQARTCVIASWSSATNSIQIQFTPHRSPCFMLWNIRRRDSFLTLLQSDKLLPSRLDLRRQVCQKYAS